MLADLISPDTIGEALIGVSMADATITPRANQPFRISFDYSRCAPVGVRLPLLLTITRGTSQESFRRVEYRLIAPAEYLVTPREGGRHIILMRECFHNRWAGQLIVEVDGPLLKVGL